MYRQSNIHHRKRKMMDSNAVRKKTQDEFAGTERILLVDDEKTIVMTYKLMLELLGYRVTGMTDSREAINHLGNSPHDYDLVITDLNMPDVPGDKLAEEVKAICPEIPVIVITGNIDKIQSPLHTTSVNSFIRKPCKKVEIAGAIRNVLDGK